MRKIVGTSLSVAVAIAMAVDGYIVFFKGNQQTAADNTVKTKSTLVKKKSTSTTAKKTSDGQYKDGTYTGEATSTQWGDVQVQIKVSNGKLATINVLQSPDSENKSVQINEQALPTYKSEAITAQSSKIQQISGATETYKGFTGSLQNALDQAQA
ncbi:FMN-binding protein [Companilactobacillus sp.]|uniref:FMN-binding protein n=1 Tax=Companilactobacillus sp. TaxID=2767905 RepID=UPI00262708AF|nr:FMN-binding protein [Companilactobacillus sp.]